MTIGSCITLQAGMRGVASRGTGLMPKTFTATISSRSVSALRSAHIAVPPAPATGNAVTTASRFNASNVPCVPC